MSNIKPVIIPKWGLTMEEGTISEWLVDTGTPVTVGMEIPNIDTDKLTNAFIAAFGRRSRRIKRTGRLKSFSGGLPNRKAKEKTMTRKTAVITGSADGLGKGIAERLAQDGFNLMLSDINAEELAQTEREFQSCNQPVAAFAGNMAAREDQFSLVAHATAAFGSVDAFINNAGIEEAMPLKNVTEADFDRVIRNQRKRRALRHSGRGRTDEEAGRRPGL